VSHWRRQQRKRARKRRDFERACKAVADWCMPRLLAEFNRPSRCLELAERLGL
jgi:hypothetical protein